MWSTISLQIIPYPARHWIIFRTPSPIPNMQHCLVDPVSEEVPELQVKIADLGNACWVVSANKSLHSSSKLLIDGFLPVNVDTPFHRGYPNSTVSQSWSSSWCRLWPSSRYLVCCLHGIRACHWRLPFRAAWRWRLLSWWRPFGPRDWAPWAHS